MLEKAETRVHDKMEGMQTVSHGRKRKKTERNNITMYKSFDGSKRKLEEMDQQHLSNIFWYNTICNGFYPDQMKFVTDLIPELLPYRPHPDFKPEIDYLDLMGHLIWNNDGTWADIVLKKDLTFKDKTFASGEVVGRMETRNFKRDTIIKDILNEKDTTD
jgi:hypothetical protein